MAKTASARSASRNQAGDQESQPSPHSDQSSFSELAMEIGFLAGLAIAGLSLVFSAFYLYGFLWNTSSSVKQLLGMSQQAASTRDVAPRVAD